MSARPGFRIEPDWHRTDDAIVATCRRLATPLLGDAMNRLGVMDSAIKTVWTEAACAGTALTVWVRAGDNLMLHKAINMAKAGDLIVVNGQGDCSRALFGELMGRSAKAVGITGLVFDGAVRDGEGLRALNLPVFARARTPAGPFKHGPGEIGRPIACGGVVCNAGDVVVADDDGVVVVPRADASDVVATALEIQKREQARREQINAGNAKRAGIDEILIQAGVLDEPKEEC